MRFFQYCNRVLGLHTTLRPLLLSTLLLLSNLVHAQTPPGIKPVFSIGGDVAKYGSFANVQAACDAQPGAGLFPVRESSITMVIISGPRYWVGSYPDDPSIESIRPYQNGIFGYLCHAEYFITYPYEEGSPTRRVVDSGNWIYPVCGPDFIVGSYRVDGIPGGPYCPAAEPPPCDQCTTDTPWTRFPFHIKTGIKRLPETDYAGGYQQRLRIDRTYQSHNYHDSVKGAWYFATHKKLIPRDNDYLLISNGRGSAAPFAQSGTAWKGDALSRASLQAVTGSNYNWQLTDANDTIERYDNAGRLISLTWQDGYTQTFTYLVGATRYPSTAPACPAVATQEGQLQCITDTEGHQLAFEYQMAGTTALISKIIDPAGNPYLYAYDADNNLNLVTYPDGSQKRYVYDEPGLAQRSQSSRLSALTGIEEAISPGVFRRFASYTYDAAGLATSGIHAGGVDHYRSYVYGGEYFMENPNQQTFKYNFIDINGISRVSALTQPAGSGSSVASTHNTYDANGNLAAHTDFNGSKTCYSYDLTRNLETTRVEGLSASADCATALAASTQAAPARKILTTWHATRHLPASITEPITGGSKVTTNTYDTNGNLTSRTVTTIVGAVTRTRTSSWTYDALGRVLTATDPLSHVTTYTYYPNTAAQNTTLPNSRNQLATVSNALGHITSITSYNAHGQPLTIVDPSGITTTLTYDTRQRIISRSLTPAGGGSTLSTSYTYDGIGQLIKVTLSDASYLSYGYDDAHRLTQISDSQNNKITYTLDNMGNRIAENTYNPGNQLTRAQTHVYDALSRLQKDIGGSTPTGDITQYSYDANGNQTATTAPLNRITTNSYDALNRLLSVSDPQNGIAKPTKYEYDSQDNLTKVTDPKNLATTYTYNGFNERTMQTSPDTGSTSYTYDNAGNLKTRTDARGITATYSYDVINRITSISYPAYGSDPAETVTFQYDTAQAGDPACSNAKGRLCKLTDKTGSTRYNYDSYGRLISKSQTGAGALTQTVSYGYNAAGQQSSMTLPSGKQITYGYTNNRITSITADGIPIIKNADYDPFGAVGEWEWGNHTAGTPNKHVRYTDLDGRTNRIESGAGQNASSIGYDIAGRITQLQKMTTPTGTTVDQTQSFSYGYDSLDRLTAATPGAGNPTTSQAYSYDPIGNRLTNMIGSTTTTYSYPATNHRLQTLTGGIAKSYTYDAGGNRTSDGTSNWTYGANGRLIQVTVSSPVLTTVQFGINARGQRVKKTVNGVTTRFIYDEAGKLLGEYDNAGALIAEHVWLGNLPVAVIKPKSPSGIDVFYVHTDQIDTPRLITRASDSVKVWEWKNADPLGNNAPNGNPSGVSLYKYNLRYPGQYADEETGTNYNYNRDYDSIIGRYIQSDPLGIRAGLNTYAYASGNPLYRSDPFGLADSQIQCDGNGNFEVINNDKTASRVCTQIHEESHIKDYIKRYGADSCKGKAKGDWPHTSVNGDDYRDFARDSECRAYAAELSCDKGCDDGGATLKVNIEAQKHYYCTKYNSWRNY